MKNNYLQNAVNVTLTGVRNGRMFFNMQKADPFEMLKLADSLEAAAKTLREAVKVMGKFAPNRGETPLEVSFEDTHPSVRDAAQNVLAAAGRPVHINDIFNEIKKMGAQVKDVSVLSSILSRDGNTFVTAEPRGHWQLTEAYRNI